MAGGASLYFYQAARKAEHLGKLTSKHSQSIHFLHFSFFWYWAFCYLSHAPAFFALVIFR
jgi:hypothetical protein